MSTYIHMRETAIAKRNAEIITEYNRLRDRGECGEGYDLIEAVRKQLLKKYKQMPRSVIREVLGL